MKRLLTMLLAMVLVLGCMAPAMADPGSKPVWTEYDKLIDEIKSTTDFVDREALMHKAEDILMATGGLCPLYYYNDMSMMRTGVEGFFSNVYNNKFFQYATYGDNSVLRINLTSEPDKLDPALNSTVDGSSLAVTAFGGLYAYNAEGQTVPDFAESCAVSEDGLTYVFTLRDGLKWSDGTPLTAKDFEYSWKRAANPETAADYSYMYNGIAGFEENDLQVKASEDGKTFTVQLAAPCAYFFDLAAFPTFFPVNQACVESAVGYKDDTGAMANPGAWALEAGFVSSGAYTLQAWEHNQSMTYVKNPNYWNAENVKIEKLEFMLSADETAIFSAYQAGDLDFIDIVPTDEIVKLKGTPECYIAPCLGTYYVIFNVANAMFDGMTVDQASAMRKGLSALIDRQYIIDTVAMCEQEIATTFIPAAMLDGHGGEFKKDDADYTYPVNGGYYEKEPNVDAAIALLEEAGFKFENGMLSPETPIAFEYLTNDNSGDVAIAECIQQDMAVIGVDMTIKSAEWNVFLNERKAGNYGIARNGWMADFNDPVNMLEMWTTTSGNNDAQFGR
ncbi:MAG: ABC transporter substrate-binding protein [Clostridia bacterium]